jgi:16S rRNA (cytosine1402-N4)-methyltransferase
MVEEKGQFSEQDSSYHIPVLLQESIDALQIKPDGVYVDCTFGGGGHSRAILSKLGKEGRLFAFDQDDDAKANVPDDERITFLPYNFKYLQRFLKLNAVLKVDGILADLGVSSYQFDTAEKGFSTRFEGPLDMRMDNGSSLTAEQLLLTYTEQQLHKMFEQYGEVTNSKTLAKHIVACRNKMPLTTTFQLKEMLAPIVKGNPNKYFSQVFQAIRMEVNDEMGVLKEMLLQTPDLLKEGGRLAVITFHSIEDRIVKVFMRDETFEEEVYNPFSRDVKEKKLTIIAKKAIEAKEDELRKNKRSRSARLRVAERK